MDTTLRITVIFYASNSRDGEVIDDLYYFLSLKITQPKTYLTFAVSSQTLPQEHRANQQQEVLQRLIK